MLGDGSEWCIMIGFALLPPIIIGNQKQRIVTSIFAGFTLFLALLFLHDDMARAPVRLKSQLLQRESELETLKKKLEQKNHNESIQTDAESSQNTAPPSKMYEMEYRIRSDYKDSVMWAEKFLVQKGMLGVPRIDFSLPRENAETQLKQMLEFWNELENKEELDREFRYWLRARSPYTGEKWMTSCPPSLGHCLLPDGSAAPHAYLEPDQQID